MERVQLRDRVVGLSGPIQSGSTGLVLGHMRSSRVLAEFSLLDASVPTGIEFGWAVVGYRDVVISVVEAVDCAQAWMRFRRRPTNDDAWAVAALHDLFWNHSDFEQQWAALEALLDHAPTDEDLQAVGIRWLQDFVDLNGALAFDLLALVTQTRPRLARALRSITVEEPTWRDRLDRIRSQTGTNQ